VSPDTTTKPACVSTTRSISMVSGDVLKTAATNGRLSPTGSPRFMVHLDARSFSARPFDDPSEEGAGTQQAVPEILICLAPRLPQPAEVRQLSPTRLG
jgi:hypothetical protein